MIEDYLRLLGVPRRAPSAAYLRVLHRAQVTRVPYTNAEILLGRPGTVAADASLRRVVGGRGGYCFHLNGAFSELLRGLGFTVTLHRAYVVHAHHVVDTELNHLALLVHDLPDPANPGGRWLADAGLGDALYGPLPLVDGEHEQGPFAYALTASPRPETGWRLRHDPAGSFAACDIVAAPAVLDDFAGAHERLSTSADSPFTGFLTAQRRTAAGVDILRGCTLLAIDATGRREEHVATRERWREVLAELFGLTGDDLDALWPGALAAHEEWLARRRGKAATVTGNAEDAPNGREAAADGAVRGTGIAAGDNLAAATGA
ncbi:arylamine N-acetyltransferase [Catellatospora methionotrophica]|uniref:Arylamine N-acetyltransferase n=1 Tax=Catellatospora methionotrophica TaxID=121620 RepID=A0A8J3PIP0_9ACTN|nr:arylamine N-acetyltransferase [Catellatospora methionotrophica]GIG17959.1 arylamine N-acetyltransferase [Catellatospora methionotrophica]